MSRATDSKRAVTTAHITIGSILFAASTVPFWAAAIPPSTDLPQHLGQLFLLEKTLAGERPDLLVTPWFYPNTLIYWLLYGFWKLADPVTAGKLALSALAVLWTGSTWVLCHIRKRPFENWLIGTPLVFNFLFSWGLLNFIIGWPVFCAFIAIAGLPESRRKTASLILIALLLYYAHALWFLMANVWLLLQMFEGRGWREWRSMLPLLPPWVLALVWYPKLVENRQSSAFETRYLWEDTPLDRLDHANFTDAALGSLHGSLEPAFMLLLGAWLLTIILTRWKDLEHATDKKLLLAAMLLLLAYWMLPSAYMNTIFFNRRWLPCGLGLLLIALPGPRLRKAYLHFLGAGCFLVFSSAAAINAKDWEAEQLDGFLQALSQVSANDKVLGLNLMDGSFYIKGRPGLQLFAYAQALRGAETHFSFTEHYSGAVQFHTSGIQNPVRHLVASPSIVSKTHLSGFTKILIHGNETLHEVLARRLKLSPIGSAKTSWRLYRIERDQT